MQLLFPNVVAKNREIASQWNEAPKQLKALTMFAAALIFAITGQETIITSIFRGDNPNSVHAHWRGIDLRTKHLPEGAPKMVEEIINESIIYDPARPHLQTALFHDSGQGEHLHLQMKG